MQGLANTAWAFAMAGQSDEKLFVALARAAEQHVGNFHEKGLLMTLWVFSGRECLKDAWSVFDRAKHIGVPFSPLCSGDLLMECEQRG